jgi:hypothetical protein
MSKEGRRTIGSLLFEVVLIAVGVFLALLANNWNEDREHHGRARAALQYFLGEMDTNRATVQRERTYHETLAQELDVFLHSNEPLSQERLTKEVHFTGMHPIIFEHTAWDLALATQALSYIEPDLAFNISKVYTQQNAFQTLENSFLASAFTPASMAGDNLKGLATAMRTYLGDVNVQEPLIISSYDKVIPDIKRILDRQK